MYFDNLNVYSLDENDIIVNDIVKKREGITMLNLKWKNAPTKYKVRCVNTNAKKYLVSNVLTVGKEYEVKNETEEFIFIIDNTGKVGGYYKEYFEKI